MKESKLRQNRGIDTKQAHIVNRFREYSHLSRRNKNWKKSWNSISFKINWNSDTARKNRRIGDAERSKLL